MSERAILLPKWLRFLLIIVLVIGVLFRLVNIDRKIYWHDEVFTSLTISGITQKEVEAEFENGTIITVKDLEKYQAPSLDKSLSDTIYRLAVDEPQLPPLYFSIVKLWVNLFGNSITAIRSVSIIFSLLALPCIYWLSLELFKSSNIAWIATALLAISPLHVLYAQEARMYSLYTVDVLLSSIALLRAIRLQTKLSWIVYTATITIGMYTHVLFSLLSAVHGSYILISQGLKWNKTLISYIIATLIGLITFAPWIVVMFVQYPQIDSRLSWLSDSSSSLLKTVISWSINFSRILFDFQASYNLERFTDYVLLLLVLGLPLILLIYSIYFLGRNSPKKQHQFIILLIFIPALLLAVPDLLLGGTRSTHTRYAIITYLGCNLAFAYLFAGKIVTKTESKVKPKLWSILFISVISLELISCSFSYNKYAWWNKYFSSDNIQISRIIEREKSPLIISQGGTVDMDFGNLLSLSYSLSDRTSIQLFRKLDITKIPNNFDSVLVFNPSPELQNEIQSKYGLHLEKLYQNYLSLWKLKQ